MSQAIERDDIALSYVSRIRDLVSGKRQMPAVQYQFSRSIHEIHASDLDGLCMWKTYFRRTVDDPPEMSDDQALKFLRGRVIERAIGTEQEPFEHDGIICTIDDCHPDYGMAEIKSVVKNSRKFDPLDKYNGFPHWITRCRGYCYARRASSMVLVVYFVVGAMWERGGKKVDLKAWQLMFDTDELVDNWAAMQKRRTALIAAFTESELPPAEYAASASWECKGCGFASQCPKLKF